MTLRKVYLVPATLVGPLCTIIHYFTSFQSVLRPQQHTSRTQYSHKQDLEASTRHVSQWKT